MRQSAITCAACGKHRLKPTSAVNRASRAGMNLYCDRSCAGVGRRVERSDEERRQIKAEYDAVRRVKLADEIKAAKREHHLRTYDPAKASIERKRRAPAHAEYCRRPEYRAWKAEYDRKHLAEKQFGEFGEVALLLRDLETEVSERMSRLEIATLNGTLNKRLQRKREHEHAYRR